MPDKNFGQNSHSVRQDVNGRTERHASLVIFKAVLAFFVLSETIPTRRTLSIAADLRISTCFAGACGVFPFSAVVIGARRHLVSQGTST